MYFFFPASVQYHDVSCHAPFRIIISTLPLSDWNDVYVGEKPDRLKAMLPSGVTVRAARW